MAKTVSIDELQSRIGGEPLVSDWYLVDQDRIDRFADATDDHQFIHVDPERAAQTPLGATIAHGFLTLALLPKLYEELAVAPEGTVLAFNYGLDRVRFLQPVKAGSRIRLVSKLLRVQERNGGRVLVKAEATVEIEGEERPAMVAETLSMFVTA